MALDRRTFVSPPSNTTFAFTQIETNEEIMALWQAATLPVTLTNALPNNLTGAVFPPLTAYTDTQQFRIIATSANTGNMTLSLDNLPALPLVTASNSNITAGQVVAGQMLFLAFDSTINAFRVLGGFAPGTVIPNPTQQWQVLQADAGLNWQPSQQLFAGNF